MEIDVGDFVRTKYGIFKIRNITKDLGYHKREKRVIELDRNIPEEHYNFQFYKDYSIFKNAKFNPNIIKLIEVGDVIVGKDNHKFEVYAVGSDCVYINELKEFILVKDIKGVVTKEQFLNCEYRIGD